MCLGDSQGRRSCLSTCKTGPGGAEEGDRRNPGTAPLDSLGSLFDSLGGPYDEFEQVYRRCRSPFIDHASNLGSLIARATHSVISGFKKKLYINHTVLGSTSEITMAQKVPARTMQHTSGQPDQTLITSSTSEPTTSLKLKSSACDIHDSSKSVEKGKEASPIKPGFYLFPKLPLELHMKVRREACGSIKINVNHYISYCGGSVHKHITFIRGHKDQTYASQWHACSSRSFVLWLSGSLRKL